MHSEKWKDLHMKQKTESNKVSSGYTFAYCTVNHIRLQKKGEGVCEEFIRTYTVVLTYRTLNFSVKTIYRYYIE